MTAGTLFVVATPIGNLEDMTLRAIRTLEEADVIAAEDTRVTSKLLRHFEINTPAMSIRGEGGKRNIETLTGRLCGGERVALVTDAGTPSVSDPGYDLVAKAHESHIVVSPIPGPSALAAAVSVVGLRGEGVRFFGFLPRGGRRRKEMLAALRTERALTIFYESPRRLKATLDDMAGVCGERNGAVLRELTKIHEEIGRGTLNELAERYGEGPIKGEIIIALEGNLAEGSDMSEDALRTLIMDELAAGQTVKDVAAAISKGFGLSRKSVYQLALELHRERNSR